MLCTRPQLLLLALFVLTTLSSACAAQRAAEPQMAPLPIDQGIMAASQAPQAVEDNYFQRDRSGQVSEEALKVLLDSPVFLEDDTRLGIVPVAVAYEIDDTLPLSVVPETLGNALEGTGFFDVTSEMATDWPTDASLAGLRELAARYRTRYMLLYRHRFTEASYTNNWGWSYLTLVAIPFVPSQTLSTAGVLEATLFDAQAGTVLFTAYERVSGTVDDNLWHNDMALSELKGRLLKEASEKLSAQVVGKVHRLVAMRDKYEHERQREAQPAAYGQSI